MRTILLILIIVFISYASRVQSNDTTNNSSLSEIVIPYDSEITDASLLVAQVGVYGGNADISITDVLSNSWVVADSIYNVNGNYKITTLYAKNSEPGYDTLTITLSTARSYIRIVISEYSDIDTTSPLLATTAKAMNVNVGANSFYTDSLYASDTCLALLYAQESDCSNFVITAGGLFTVRDSTNAGYDIYVLDSTVETAGDSVRGELSTAGCDGDIIEGVFCLFKHLESGGAGCTNPVIPNVGVSDTIGDTIWYHHTATLNDFDSIKVAVIPGGDTAWAVNYDANDSIAYIPRHIGVDKILKLVWYACETSDTVYDTIDVIWDTLKTDSVEYVPSGDRMADGDTMYTDDTLDIKGWFGRISGYTVPAYLTKEDSGETALRVIANEMTGDSIGAKFVFGICDTVSCDTLTDSLVYAGNVPDPVVTDDPNDSTVDISGTYSIFIACYTPRGANSFQWQDSTGLGWANITGETDSTFDTVAVYDMNGFKYRCVVSNNRSSGPDTSTVSTLSVNLNQFTIDTTWGVNLSAWTITEGLTVDSGTMVHTSVTCAANHSFTAYTGDHTGTDAIDSFTITANMSIGASCEPDSFTLTINKYNTGTIDTLPAGKVGLFQYDELCTLVCTPGVDSSVFFAGDTTSTNGDSAFITMNSNKTVNVTFDLEATAPTVGTHPTDCQDTVFVICTTFVAVSGTAPLSYQWQWKYSGGSWGDSSSLTNDSIFIELLPDLDGDSIRCIVTNAYGVDTSNGAVINAYIKQYDVDTSYTANCAITTPNASLTFDSLSICTLIVTPADGYATIWPGGTIYYSDIDTLLITVTEDSTVSAVAYLIPVIDSIRLKNPPLRDSTYTYSARNNDTVIIYCNELYAEGDSSKVWQNSSGSSVFTVVTWNNDENSIVAIPAASSPRGYYKSRVMNQYEIISTTPASPNFRIKVPSIGSP